MALSLTPRVGVRSSSGYNSTSFQCGLSNNGEQAEYSIVHWCVYSYSSVSAFKLGLYGNVYGIAVQDSPTFRSSNTAVQIIQGIIGS